MNRIIFDRREYPAEYLTSLGKPYDYYYNPDSYGCVDVDDETLCVLKLKYVVWKHTLSDGRPLIFDMPTYMPTYVCSTKLPA